MHGIHKGEGFVAQPIVIATDGSCIQQGNYRVGDDTARPGACGFVARLQDGSKVRRAVPFADGTIGAMEVKGLLMALEAARVLRLDAEGPMTIKCDSEYAVKGFNEYLDGWERKGWRGSKGVIANLDDWRNISLIRKELGSAVSVQWVKGHSTDPLNNEVDALVNGAARSQKGIDETGRLPHHGLYVTAVRSDRDEPVPPPASIENVALRGGIRAQAADLLVKAAEDPQIASLLARGLDMALANGSATEGMGRGAVEEARALQQALSRSSQGR